MKRSTLAQSVDDSVNSITPFVLLGDISLKEGDCAGAHTYYRKALAGFATVTRKPRFTLALFAGIADLYAAREEWVQATELAAFVKHHPFRHAYWSPHERAGRLLACLETKLSAPSLPGRSRRRQVVGNRSTLCTAGGPNVTHDRTRGRIVNPVRSR